jgi:hypothetical protein
MFDRFISLFRKKKEEVIEPKKPEVVKPISYYGKIELYYIGGGEFEYVVEFPLKDGEHPTSKFIPFLRWWYDTNEPYYGLEYGDEAEVMVRRDRIDCFIILKVTKERI